MFGGDGMLGEAGTQGAVTAVRFCLLLVLPARCFRTLLAERPESGGSGERTDRPG